MKNNYLKKVCVILSHSKQLLPFEGLLEKLRLEGVECEAFVEGEAYAVTRETLYVTDCASVLKQLTEQGLSVLVCSHEENRGEDFSQAGYVIEQPEELEAEYLERVYRRFAGLPWDILETERCFLRESTVEDVDAFYAIYKEAAITRYMEDLFEHKVSEQAYIQEYIEKVYSYYEFGIWTVILKETGEIIGRAGLSVREGFALPELGYVIGVPWQGRGLAREVCQGILQLAGEEYAFEQVQALIQKGNEASMGLARSLGFVEQGEHLQDGREYLLFVRNV